MRSLLLPALVLLVAAAGPGAATAPPDESDMRLLRTPDIHGDQIVFTYGGNLWTVPTGGGEARRLTSHVGYEFAPKFSPDGKQIAFSGDYDGNTDVFVLPARGGEPVRLTYHPQLDRVIDWQPDGRSVRFQSARASHTGGDLQLWTVPTTGGLPARMILPTGGLSSFAPDGKRLAYNRKSREMRTWKRYKGGMAQDIWIYDFDRNDTEQITDWVGTDSFPMWHGDTIYFLSDRTGRLQIWAHDLARGHQRQVTDHDEYDVKWPSHGPAAIVYENGGWLYVLDLESEKTRQITVSLRDDRIHTRPFIKTVADRIRSGDIAPDGKRVIMGARGEIFTLPAEKGNVRNLTATPGVRERRPAWSPDGKWIAYFSDETGEYEIHLRQGDGKSEPRRLTKRLEFYPRGLAWSPDSEKLLCHDAAQNLLWVDVESGKQKRIDQGAWGEIFAYDWSPDSRWVAYAKGEENQFYSIFLYNLDSEEITSVTTDLTNESSPVFDPAGKYLYFTSDRHFNPTLGGYDLKPVWTNQDGLYLVTLKADEPYPFAPESDEVEVAGEDDEDEEDGEDENGEEDGEDDDDEEDEAEEDEEEVPPTEIDLDRIGERIVEIDLDSGNYFALSAAEDKLFYMSRPTRPGTFGGSGTLKIFDLAEREEGTVLEECNGYALSADGQKILYASEGSFGIVDAAADQKPSDEPLRTAEMRARVDPRAEWEQMFHDAWRQERDFFYDPGMHGVDWDKMRERYGQLVPYVAHRADLNYLLGELLGELCSSHSYVGGGEMPQPERIGTGLLGCDFVLDEDSGRYRLARIFTDRDWNRDQSTPLHVPGNEVAEGDFLLAVDGRELSAPLNPYSLFEGKVGQQVLLEVGPEPDREQSHEITVVPIASEAGLRYEAWVQDNRRQVDRMSDGKIGYLHLPNTAVAGVQNFAKGYYPQLRKEGLIIDERYNGGGWVPDFFMAIMGQKLANMWKSRYGQVARTPGTAFLGHLAMISNGYAGSGGDCLPYYFKFYELGPVVGTRTWGGLVGIRRFLGLMDGGGVTVPEFGIYSLEGEWVVENYGVDPTVPVDNLPHEVIDGRDPQLEKAVEVLLHQIAEDPIEVPEHGRFPRDKTR